MKDRHFNIGIIGGGAAGLMAAIAAGQAGCRSIALFEGNVRCGTKILMSGGTRCNVTNEKVGPQNFYGGNTNFIKNILNAFDDKATIKFFRSLGVELKLEPTGKYFPVDDNAGTVLNALLAKIKNSETNIYLSTKIEDISFEENSFFLKAKEKRFICDKVIIASGGKSYPSTGSDGSGYKLAVKFHHSITPVFPALSPILLNEPKLAALSGITIQAKLSLFLSNKKHIEFEDSLLITHFGISGPAALNISREVERLKKEKIYLIINFLPQLSFESFQDILMEQIKNHSEKSVLNFFKQYLPDNLCETLFKISKVDLERKFYSLSKNEIKQLALNFTSYRLHVNGVKGFKQAEATAGGIPLNEVRYQTMESKMQPGLYFAGEILDVDGLIGGYNFQWAWSSGFVAGSAAGKC